MQLIVGFCRYALPVLAFLILFKCLLTLLIGHPVNKTYGYIIDSNDGEKIPLNTWETSIGRSRSCDIVLTYQSISRFHAAICRRVDGWYIFDTNSKYGTFVNGTKIENEATVKNDDIITFGDCRFRFIITDDPVIEVGKKRRAKKQKPVEKTEKEPYKPEYTPPKEIVPPKQEERYDDFESIQIEFHPKKTKTETPYTGRISDLYSDEGDYPYAKFDDYPSRKENTQTQAAIYNPSTGETFLLCAEKITLGRSRNSDIRIDDRSVSRNHALLEYKKGKWYISDMGSTYGTFVGSRKIDELEELKNGDTLKLSNVELKFTSDYR